MMTHKDAPPEMQMSPEWRDKIMHVRLNVNGAILMGSDAPPNFYKAPQGLTVSLQVAKPADAERVFKGTVPGRQRDHGAATDLLGARASAW